MKSIISYNCGNGIKHGSVVGKNDYCRNTNILAKTSGKVFKSVVGINVWSSNKLKNRVMKSNELNMSRFLLNVAKRISCITEKTLVVKRDSFSVMSALMYNIKFYELKNIGFISI